MRKLFASLILLTAGNVYACDYHKVVLKDSFGGRSASSYKFYAAGYGDSEYEAEERLDDAIRILKRNFGGTVDKQFAVKIKDGEYAFARKWDDNAEDLDKRCRDMEGKDFEYKAWTNIIMLRDNR